MANPSQSQDVEHKGPRSGPLYSRRRQRQPRGPSQRSTQGELDREAEPGPKRPEDDRSKLSQHGTNTPSRPNRLTTETAMSTPADRLASVASDAGALLQRMAGAVAPSRSTVGRIVSTAAAAKAGARLFPTAWRLFKRHPLSASFIIVGLVAAACLLPQGVLTREKPLA